MHNVYNIGKLCQGLNEHQSQKLVFDIMILNTNKYLVAEAAIWYLSYSIKQGEILDIYLERKSETSGHYVIASLECWSSIWKFG